MAQTEQHTPGPWFVGPVNSDPDEGVIGETAIQSRLHSPAGHFCPAVALPFPNCPGMVEANARLIAAAPESHEANIEAADFLLATFAQTGNPDAPEGWDDLDAYAVYAKLRTAIAKATGAAS